MSTQEANIEHAITRQLGRFARILDGKHWDDLGEVFAEDLTFNYGAGGEQAGLEALRCTVSAFLDICGPTQHLIGSIVVTVGTSGDEGLVSSRAYVQARHQRAGDITGPVFDTCGDYIDEWACHAGKWHIVRRDVDWLLHNGDPAVLGVVPAVLA